MGRSGEAVGYSRQALSVVQETGDRHGEGITLSKLGTALCADGQTNAARRCWHDSVAILDGLDGPKAAETRMLLENSMHAKPASMMPNSRRSHAERH